jgi:hypothetical protein
VLKEVKHQYHKPNGQMLNYSPEEKKKKKKIPKK